MGWAFVWVMKFSYENGYEKTHYLPVGRLVR
jgi:hypothetical protein